MQVRILGCSGGIGSGLKTTSILLDEDILIDAGTGVGDLTLEELRRLRHVFLTHSHLDHVVGLPLFVDAAFESYVRNPLQVHARKETIDALQAHLFNDVMWPDFSVLPNAARPVLNYREMQPGDQLTLGEREFRAVDVKHAVPTLGYCVKSSDKVIAFSGDTTTNRTLWPVLNDYRNLDVLIIEVSFPNQQAELAMKSGHYCPRTFARDLEKLKHDPAIWLTAMKPGEEELIMDEVCAELPGRSIRRLESGSVICI